MTNIGEWVAWHGGECPVPAGTGVEVELASGDLIETSAGNLEWGCGDGEFLDPIRRYRILGEPS
jgi:hypothetical protein